MKTNLISKLVIAFRMVRKHAEFVYLT